ncbi:MAG: hypothetical protein WBF71_04590, partial [Microthrixaceae bacterium]
SQAVLTEVFGLLKRLDAGIVMPQPLHDFAKTGNPQRLRQTCRRAQREPEYRIVVRGRGGTFTVSEVIAVEDRTQDLPYLLAGLRLGRIDDAVRRSDAGRRVHRIRKILNQQ